VLLLGRVVRHRGYSEDGPLYPTIVVPGVRSCNHARVGEPLAAGRSQDWR
jgi:hypothetical protein